MYTALVLVRNVESSAPMLDFGEFTISRVSLRFDEFRGIFRSQDVYQLDWVFKKCYSDLPVGPAVSPAGVGGIPIELEEILLLLRLYKPGDIAFVRQVIISPEGRTLVQHPYGAMNNLNSDSVLPFNFAQGDCQAWKAFANGLRTSQSWRSEWFSVARHFFLRGGAKEFTPEWDEVDRIVDYATALEATLVPEHDFSRRRISSRAASLVSPDEQLVKRLYDIRSTIVHGSKLSDEKRQWLLLNCAQIEVTIRQVLVAAVQKIPNEKEQRCAMLSSLYDPTDKDRGESVLQKFQELKTDAVRKEIAAKISKLAGT